MAIQPLKIALDETFSTIKKYQSGEIKQVKTNRPWLDHQGGVTPRSLITIVASSFGGKSTELENLKSDIMNVEINEEAGNYVWLSNAYEMTNFATTLRDVKKLLKSDFKNILGKDFTEEDKEKLKKYYLERTDGRFFVNQVPQTSKEFLQSVDDFLAQHIDKSLVVLDLDHAGLIKSSSENKKISVDDVVEGLNELKNKYSNFLVVILMQLNRSILTRVAEKSNQSAIQRGDFYQSDTVYHISDYIYGLQNADFVGIEQYRLINPEKYPHLSHRFTDENKHGKVSLITEGCIFVEVLKDRTADIGFTDLYTIEIKPFEKPRQATMMTPIFTNTPVFEKETPLIPKSLADAFGAPNKTEEPPPF
jgi:hypothetical protein